MSSTNAIFNLRPLKRLFRLALWLLVIFFFFFGSLWLALRTPGFQTFIVQKMAVWVSDRLGFECNIQAFYLDWVDFARIKGVEIKDRQGHTLIEVEQIKVNLKLRALLQKHINLDMVELRNGHVRLRVNAANNELNINQFIDAIIALVDDGDTTRSPNPSIFSIDETRLKNMAFSYFDETSPYLPGQFDYYHFTLEGIQGKVLNFWQRRDTLRLEAQNLQAVDRATKLPVKELSTHFQYTNHNMGFRQLKARIGDSYLRDSLAFYYQSPQDFSHFNQRIHIKANLDSSVVSTQDLSFFAPSLKDWFETYSVWGKFKGTVDDFRVNRFRLLTQRNSFLTGNVGFRGLPEVDSTKMELLLKPSFVNPEDLKFYAGKDAADILSMLGTFDISGTYTGTFKDFYTKATLHSGLGSLTVDMNMSLKEDLQTSTYQGKLATQNFNLGKLLKEPEKVQKIDIAGSFSGKGFALNKAKIDLDAQISKLGLLGYNYEQISTKGHFEKSIFSGDVDIKDRNLIFKAKGNIDLRKGKEIVNVEALIARANFKPLKLSTEPLDLSAEVGLNFTGLDFDNFLGRAELKNLRILYGDERLDVNEVLVKSDIKDGIKVFELFSPIADATIEGSFKYRKLIEDAGELIAEYSRIIRNKQNINREEAIAKRKSESKNYTINSKIYLKNINLILDLLDLPISVSNNTLVDGTVQFGQTEMLLVNTHVDSLHVKDQSFYNIDLDVSSSKTLERPDVLAEIYLFSKRQKWAPDFETEKLMFDGVWDKGNINFKLKANQIGDNNKADIKGNIFFDVQSTQIKLKNSSLTLVDRLWNISNQNSIEITDTANIIVKSLTMANADQKIEFEGKIGSAPTDTLSIWAEKFQLATLRPLVKEDISGTAYARMKISSLLNQLKLSGELAVDSLGYDQFLVGNFDGFAAWNQEQKAIEMQGNLFRENQKVLQFSGFYSPQDEWPLNLKAKVNRFNINILQIVLGNTTSNLKGLASGDLVVRGSFAKPIVTGTLAVRDGQVKINYLNTTYFFSHTVTFLPNEIMADGVTLIDENGQSAKVSRAALRHENFRNFYVFLEGRLNQFMVFNLSQQPGELYYGTAICSGTLSIMGTFTDMNIRANAQTDKGTRIFIPLDNTGSQDLGESFITFSQKKESNLALGPAVVEKVKLAGINMIFDLEVTEEAYGEIIFDKKAGDIIRSNGYGKLKMIIDTRGEFSVIGQYVIKKGDYHFTTYNLVNKDFDIKPGSTITWNGPVMDGIMNIKAEYNLNASLAPLASSDPQIQERPETKRRYPVVVTMQLKDQLLKPHIDLGLEILDYPKNSDLNYYVQAFQTRIATDEQELNRQVFSLMIFRMFAPMGDFVQTSNISYSSFSDLVSNQLSAWLSEFDENLEVSVDLNGLSGSALNNFQLRFSYTMLEGRLRLTRDGSFTNAQNQTSALSIAGDWTLEYMLSKDGIFRVKMFHRINQNLILSGLNNNNSTQGASLLYTQSFNRLSELLFWRKKKRTPKLPPKSKEAILQQELSHKE